jgi:hypothetical protein
VKKPSARVGVFEELCAATPLLLVIDNLHWLDNSSLLLLRRLVTICHQHPALILLTTRPSHRPELAATVLATERAGGVVIELRRLENESVLSLAADVTGGLPGPRLAARLARAVGNPLFVVELLAALLREGKIALGSGGGAEVEANLPTTTLAVSILHRLAVLTAESVELLRLAAVCGQEVDPAELSLLSGDDAVAVGTALRDAEQAGVLEVWDGHLRFRHELIHDALYNDWPEPVVRSLHRDLGVRLAAIGAPAWRIAHHLSLGAAEGDMLAVDWLHRAGLEAAHRDPFAAVPLLERAMDLAPPNAPDRDTIRTDLSVVLVWAGRADEAGKLAASVIAESLDAEVRGRTAWWLASTLVLRGRPREARAVCDSALRSGVALDTVALMLQVVAVIAAMASGEAADGPRRLHDLLAVATSVGDQIAQATCHLGLTVAEANAGRLGTASAHGAAAVLIAESVQTPQLLMVNAHVSYAWTLEEQDLLGDALATVDRLSTAVGEREEAPTTAQIERWRARAHYVAGRWDDPMVDLDSALLVNASGIDVWPEPFALRALIRIHRGEVGAAQEDLDRFEALVAAGAPVLVLDQPMLATKPTSRGSCGGTPACLRRVDRALPRRADRRHIRTRSTRRC